MRDELCRFKKKKKKKKMKKKSNYEFRQFAYKPCTGSFSYFKLANS